MYYKLYIDSVFIMQFSMNLYLLALAGRILKCTATHRKICMGAFAGAVMSCVMLFAPIFSIYARIWMSTLPVSMCMVRITYGIGRKALVKSSLIIAGCGFFMGSIMIWIENRFRMFMNFGMGVTATVLLGYIAYRLLCLIVDRVQRKGDGMCTVQIPVPALRQNIKVKALVDTGNHLTDPVSHKPVCVISRELAKTIESSFYPEKYHAIPYSSVGKERGILDAYELAYVVFEEPYREIKREQVIFAICNMGISEDSPYQMILHPRLLEN